MHSPHIAEEELESDSDYQDAVHTNRSHCSCLPCLRKWDRIDTYPNNEAKGCIWNLNHNVLMKIGFKWKRLLRKIRMNRFRSGGRKFRYDALSYSLNFNESAIENQRTSCCDEELFRREFSMRYASMRYGSGSVSMEGCSRGGCSSSSAC